MGQNKRFRGPQVLVHVSIYQGSILERILTHIFPFACSSIPNLAFVYRIQFTYDALQLQRTKFTHLLGLRLMPSISQVDQSDFAISYQRDFKINHGFLLLPGRGIRKNYFL